MIEQIKLQEGTKGKWYHRNRLKAYNQIKQWEKRYGRDQLLVDFLVADACITTRSPGKRAIFVEYLKLPRQAHLFLTRSPVPLINEVSVIFDSLMIQ